MTTIYKICESAGVARGRSRRAFRGSDVDLRDGFIHFSTAAQVAETAAKHFAGQSGLMLVAVDADALGPALKWERSRGDDLFPHLYARAAAVGGALGASRCPTRSTAGGHIPELEP